MELTELAAMLTECQKALKDAGMYSVYMFDAGKRHGADIAVQTSNENMPNGQAVYDTSTYADYAVKNVVVDGVAFFTLLTLSEAFEEGVPDFWGVLN